MTRLAQTCETSRRNIASVPSCDHLATRARFWDGETVNLRWILIHMIEEYARHNVFLQARQPRLTSASVLRNRQGKGS